MAAAEFELRLIWGVPTRSLNDLEAGLREAYERSSVKQALDQLPAPVEWVEHRDSPARFSEYHSRYHDFALPFNPDAFLWAPRAIEFPLSELDPRTGHYRRGVNRWRRRMERGEPIDPIVLIFTSEWGWSQQDGNHRIEAAILVRRPTLGVVLAMAKEALARYGQRETEIDRPVAA